MKRVLTAVVLLPIFIFALWSSTPYYFIALVAAAVVLGLREFYLLAEKVGCQCNKALGYMAALLVLVGFYRQDAQLIVGAILLLQAALLMLPVFNGRRFESVLISSSATVAGVLYVAAFLGYLVLLRMAVDHKLAAKLLSLFFFIIFAGDTGAYYTGRLIGRRKLAPHISPGKTIEGSIGGLLASLAAAVISKFWFFAEMQLAHALVLALIMNFIGQVGDLCESLLKRGSDVKDAAAILPGHGGMLDRLDSIIFNAPIIYWYYRFFYHS